ncbi:MAG: hypothetical protein M0012_03690 [Deltaproteobacteria bacterium]|nr:hypothetical protein [Deltaproteobacteria bacterium]
MNYISYFKLKGTFKNDSKYPTLSLIAFILKIIALIYLVAALIGTLIMSFIWADEAGKMAALYGSSGFNFGSAISSFFFSLIGGIIVSILIFLLIWAHAELILVLMDIESNTSK